MGAECPYAYGKEKNMAKITRKQVDAINARCKNGFHFDLQTFMERGEKQLCKLVTLVEEKKVVKVALYWKQEIVRRKNEHGYTVPEYTGNVVPALHCAVWNKSESSPCWMSYGTGGFHDFKDAPSAKRLMNSLCEMTDKVTDRLVCEMVPEHEREEFSRKTGLIQERT